VIACLLAVATFFGNEALKEVITGETHGATAAARLESNRVKIDIAKSNASLLRVLGAANPAGHGAAAKARAHETRVSHHLRPADAHLNEEIAAHRGEVDHANAQHLDFELAEVGFEIAIVLASISIIARRRWLSAPRGWRPWQAWGCCWSACSSSERGSPPLSVRRVPRRSPRSPIALSR
jgi:hypothetical protein